MKYSDQNAAPKPQANKKSNLNIKRVETAKKSGDVPEWLKKKLKEKADKELAKKNRKLGVDDPAIEVDKYSRSNSAKS